MKVLLIFAILAIAQPLFATQSLNQCFEELDQELDEHEKSLEVDSNQELADDNRRSHLAGSNKDGLLGGVTGLLGVVQALLKQVFGMLPDLITIIPGLIPTAPQGDVGRQRVLHNVMTKMVDLYQPFIESNKKFKRILEKLSNNAQV